MWPFARKSNGQVLPEKQLTPAMPAVKEPLEAKPVAEIPNRFDYKGQEIFNILKCGLETIGVRAIPGTMTLQRDKWGDGLLHFKGEYEMIPDTGIIVIIDDVEISRRSWNAMKAEERRRLCLEHKVRLEVRDGPNADQ